MDELTKLLINNTYLCFLDYVAIKLYFQDKLDWDVKGNPPVNIPMQSFYKRNDCKTFKGVVERHNSDRESWRQFFISLFIYDDTAYVRDALDYPDGLLNFHKIRMAMLESLYPVFKLDIGRIQSYLSIEKQDFMDFIKPRTASPDILTSSGATGISLETIALLDRVFAFTDIATVSPRWDVQRRKIKKYSLLLPFDWGKIKPALDDLISQPL